MKLKFILCIAILLVYQAGLSQYIVVKARYTETRMVDNSPLPPSRENRLILSFFEVNAAGVHIPVVLYDYPIWIYKEGVQYGSLTGGVLDSSGNNYPGYTMTAPKVVAYYNSYIDHYIDCSPNMTVSYIVNGHELDCGFIPVSHWEEDIWTLQQSEYFTAPNVCLPYYTTYPYPGFPGNLNFNWPIPPTAPYNWYSFSCNNSTQQVAVRGVLLQDSSLLNLPISLDNVKAVPVGNHDVKISWSNLTESDIKEYTIERSVNGNLFESIGKILPILNNGSNADYEFTDKTISTTGVILYRIKAEENSGHFIYSEILRIEINKTVPVLSVFPNPVANGRLSIQINDLPKGRYQVILINGGGNEKLLNEISHVGGPLSRSIDLVDLKAGIYFVIVRSPEKQWSEKIIIR